MTGGASQVGVVVHRLRVERGWSVRALAERAGISATQLTRIERLEASPTEETIRGLATALGVPASILLDDWGAHGSDSASEPTDLMTLPPAFRAAVRHLIMEAGIPDARRGVAEQLILATTRAICVSVLAEDSRHANEHE